jgi:DNA-binding CsgD family transcriptional regulator
VALKDGAELDSFTLGSFRVLVLSDSALATLTPAEREIVGLVALGMTNREIARERGSAMRTVANQLASAYRKLRVGSRFELIARLRETE